VWEWLQRRVAVDAELVSALACGACCFSLLFHFMYGKFTILPHVPVHSAANGCCQVCLAMHACAV
jgi:hypothetical protein